MSKITCNLKTIAFREFRVNMLFILVSLNMLFILVSLNILLHIYPHTALLTILDAVRVLPISSMYQNFNPQFTSPLSSLASVLPLMPPLFGIHSLKTSVHHPLWPLLERSSKPISMQRLILLSSLFLWLLRGANLFFVPGL